jgi:hypothetical protein
MIQNQQQVTSQAALKPFASGGIFARSEGAGQQTGRYNFPLTNMIKSIKMLR